jgi:hypothetical protein
MIKLKPQCEFDQQESEKLALLWYYSRHMGCKYSDEIEYKLDALEKNLYE